MSGSHNAPPPHVTDDYGDERTCYDLRTVQQREADDIAALRLEYESLRDALAYTNKRLDAIEKAAGIDLGRQSHQLAAHTDELLAMRGALASVLARLDIQVSA